MILLPAGIGTSSVASYGGGGHCTTVSPGGGATVKVTETGAWVGGSFVAT